MENSTTIVETYAEKSKNTIFRVQSWCKVWSRFASQIPPPASRLVIGYLVGRQGRVCAKSCEVGENHEVNGCSASAVDSLTGPRGSAVRCRGSPMERRAFGSELHENSKQQPDKSQSV